MFCVKCGNEIEKGAVVCPNCGTAVTEENKTDNTVQNANPILSAGVNGVVTNQPAKPKSLLCAGFLAALPWTGCLGMHDFYLGRTALGIVKILLLTVGSIVTCGISAVAVLIWTIVDAAMIFSGKVNDANGNPLV